MPVAPLGVTARSVTSTEALAQPPCSAGTSTPPSALRAKWPSSFKGWLARSPSALSRPRTAWPSSVVSSTSASFFDEIPPRLRSVRSTENCRSPPVGVSSTLPLADAAPPTSSCSRPSLGSARVMSIWPRPLAAAARHLEGEARARHRDLVEPPRLVGLQAGATAQLDRLAQQAGRHVFERELLEHALPVDLLAVLVAARRQLEMALAAQLQARQHREGREVGEIDRDLAIGRLGRRHEAAPALQRGERRVVASNDFDDEAAVGVQAELGREIDTARRRRALAEHLATRHRRPSP